MNTTKSIAVVENERIVNRKTSLEQRHYLCSLSNVKSFAHATRAHWGLENFLHWVLDVTFRENDSRICTGYALEKFNILRQLSMCYSKKSRQNLSLTRKRFKALLRDKFREDIIFAD